MWEIILAIGTVLGIAVSVSALATFIGSRRDAARAEGAFTEKVADMAKSMERAWTEIECLRDKTHANEKDQVESKADIKYMKDKLEEIAENGRRTADAVQDLARSLAKS